MVQLERTSRVNYIQVLSVFLFIALTLSRKCYIWIMDGWFEFSNCTLPIDYKGTVQSIVYHDEGFYYE